jgi:hypothetical protein
MKKKKRPRPSIPPELGYPFPLSDLIKLARDAKTSSFSPEDPVRFETKRRLLLMADWLDEPWPDKEFEWLRFLFSLLVHFRVPGFTFKRKAGASVKWNRKRESELVRDVTSLIRRRGMTAHSACVYIVGHPKQFDNRYGQDYKTLYDRFRRARQNAAHFEPPVGGIRH